VLRLRADAELAAGFDFSDEDHAGRLVVPSREPAVVGEPITVEIGFGALSDEVELSGRVQSIEARDNAPARVTIKIDAAHRARAVYVRKVLAGSRPASARNHRRVPTDLNASWKAGGHRTVSRIRDLSRGGAFLVSRRIPRVGEVVSVEIGAHASLPASLHVEGTVSWIRRGNRDHGFGVCFKVRDRDLAAQLHRVVKEHERTADHR